jgi:hypothetical protein
VVWQRKENAEMLRSGKTSAQTKKSQESAKSIFLADLSANHHRAGLL